MIDSDLCFSFSKLFVLLVVASVTVATEVPGIGNCPRVSIFPNFDVSRFFGRVSKVWKSESDRTSVTSSCLQWYEICAYPNKLTIGGSCVYSTYAWSTSNGITVYNKQISMGKEKQYLGTATVISNGVLGVTYPAYRKGCNRNRFQSLTLLLQPRPTPTTTSWIQTTRTML